MFEAGGVSIPSKVQVQKDIARWVEGKLSSGGKAGNTGAEAILEDAEVAQDATQVGGSKGGLACEAACDSRMAKIITILKHFDVDLDGCLLCHELANLWMASMGRTLTKEQYEEACYMANTDPEAGIDAKALAALYEDGMVDLGKDFGGLQEE